MINIPTKNGKNKSYVVYPEHMRIIRTYADTLYKKTGRFSESEAMRQLVEAGAKALKVKEDDHVHGRASG